MSNTAIKIENLSKQYRLGVIGTGTISHDLNRFFAKIRGKEDPFLKIGETNDRTTTGESDLVWALKDINFEVQQGEILGIIGKNGAGKSTLLKILSKVTGPTTGSIKARGRIASLLEVGTGFHPELTGRENIYLNGAILGMTKLEIKSKLDEIVDFAGVERYIDTPVKRYSSGMMVRLGFAVAAHLEPEILVVDEVLAVGDAEFQKKAVGKMKDVSTNQGRTVLFVSHNMGAVKSLCTRAIVLENGMISNYGKTDEMISYYLKGKSYLINKKDFLEHEFTNEGFKLNSIGIKLKNGSYEDAITMADTLEFIIDYIDDTVENTINFTLRFKGEDGEYLFVTSTGDNSVAIVEKGHHQIVMEIPSNFFNTSIFYVDLLVVGINGKIIHILNDVVSFGINPKKEELGAWMKKTKGFLRPLFNWKVIK